MPPEVLDLGTRYRSVKSKASTVAFGANEVRSIELPRTHLYTSVLLRLSGTIDVTVAGALGSDEIPLELIKKVEIIADGRKLIVSASGRTLYRLGHFQRGIEPARSGPTTAGVATTAFRALIPIDFGSQRMVLPVESYFDPRPYEKVELRITWGAITDLVTGGTTAFTVAPQVEVFIYQTIKGVELARFNRLHIEEKVPVASTSSALLQRVPRAGLLAGFSLSSLGGSNGKFVDDAILNFYSLRSDANFLHVDRPSWNDLLQATSVDWLASLRTNPDGTALAASIAAPTMVGHAYVNMIEDGMLSSALNTMDLQTLDHVLDVLFGAATDQLVFGYIFYEAIA